MKTRTSWRLSPPGARPIPRPVYARNSRDDRFRRIVRDNFVIDALVLRDDAAGTAAATS